MRGVDELVSRWVRVGVRVLRPWITWVGMVVALVAVMLGGCIGIADATGVYRFHGKVIEQATGKPISGAIVKLKDPGMFMGCEGRLHHTRPMSEMFETKTDADGLFQLDYCFGWGGPIWLFPPLFLFGFPRMPVPDGLTLMFEQEGLQPKTMRLYSGYLTMVEVDHASGSIVETHRTNAEGFFAGRTGYSVTRTDRIMTEGAPAGSSPGYVLDLPMVQLMPKSD